MSNVINNYEYSVLRYVNSVTEEFVNLGVIVFSKENNILLYGHQNDLTRLKEFFIKHYKDPIDTKYFSSILQQIGSIIQNINKEKLIEFESLQTIIEKFILGSDNTLQFSRVRIGYSGLDTRQTIEDVFNMYIK